MTTTFSFPFLLLLQNPDDILLFYYILARLTGLFVISPLLSQRAIAGTIRVFLSIFTTLLLLMTLYPDYHGPQAKFTLIGISQQDYGWLMLALNSLKEIGIGYLLGFCFTLLFEATMLAGEVIDAMTGFATASSFDPISATSQALLGPLLMLTTALIVLALDLHHEFIRVAADSFHFIPIGNYNMPPQMADDLILGTGLLFVYALKVAAIPFVILACGTIGIGFVIRTVPEYNPLLTGLPMRVLIAYYSVMLALSHLPPVIQQAFFQFETLSRLFMRQIGGVNY